MAVVLIRVSLCVELELYVAPSEWWQDRSTCQQIRGFYVLTPWWSKFDGCGSDSCRSLCCGLSCDVCAGVEGCALSTSTLSIFSGILGARKLCLQYLVGLTVSNRIAVYVGH